MFVELDLVLPKITIFVLAVAVFALNWGFVIFGITGMFISMFLFTASRGRRAGFLRRKCPRVTAIIDTVAYCMPYFGNVLMKNSYAQFARFTGALLDSGVSLSDAVSASLDFDLNYVVKKALRETAADISDGRGFGESLKRAGAPVEVCWFAAAGESTANLGRNLIQVADLYQDTVIASTKAFSEIVQHLVTLFMALAVGTIALAIWSPFLMIMNSLE
jgi:type II secretory pathway component PulF